MQYSKEFLNNKEGVIDLRSKSNHPITFKYSEIFQSALIKANIEDGRILPFFRLDRNAPLYKATLKGTQYNIKEKSLLAIKNELHLFYNSFQPKNIAEWFNITSPSNEEILNLPPWAAILPWRARSVESYRLALEKATLRENKINGFTRSIKKGWAHCGPVVEEKINVEAQRICKLIYSIKNKGYVRSFEYDGDICATALINDNKEWKWLVTSGYHRAFVLAALGKKEIPVRIKLVIYESDYEYWPQVLDQFYTEQEALHIFKNIFNSIQ